MHLADKPGPNQSNPNLIRSHPPSSAGLWIYRTVDLTVFRPDRAGLMAGRGRGAVMIATLDDVTSKKNKLEPTAGCTWLRSAAGARTPAAVAGSRLGVGVRAVPGSGIRRARVARDQAGMYFSNQVTSRVR